MRHQECNFPLPARTAASIHHLCLVPMRGALTLHQGRVARAATRAASKPLNVRAADSNNNHMHRNVLNLNDGRQLAYAWYGRPWAGGKAAAAAGALSPGIAPSNGGILLYLHGFASSAAEAAILHEDAVFHKLSVLAVDRPGAGLSTLNAQQVPILVQLSRDCVISVTARCHARWW
jgi:hypothetical protein